MKLFRRDDREAKQKTVKIVVEGRRKRGKRSIRGKIGKYEALNSLIFQMGSGRISISMVRYTSLLFTKTFDSFVYKPYPWSSISLTRMMSGSSILTQIFRVAGSRSPGTGTLTLETETFITYKAGSGSQWSMILGSYHRNINGGTGTLTLERHL